MNELLKKIVEKLDKKLAEEIVVIDFEHRSSITDYFVIANGTNRSQIQALADHVQEVLGKEGLTLKQTEGYNNANWILMDYQDLIIHIFDKENRLFYDLDRIWRDGKIVEKEDLKAI